jgi:hypothetical protein
MPDRCDDRHDPIQHPRDQDGERYATRRIVSTAFAAAWLPHSKPRDTRMTSGYGNSFSTCRHDWSGALPLDSHPKQHLWRSYPLIRTWLTPVVGNA